MNRKGCGITTIVAGIRIDPSIWAACQEAAQSENLTRNEVIVREICKYLKRKSKNK